MTKSSSLRTLQPLLFEETEAPMVKGGRVAYLRKASGTYGLRGCVLSPFSRVLHVEECLWHYFMEREEGLGERDEGVFIDREEQKATQKEMIELNFGKGESGLLPAIVQDAESGEVLMLAYINQASWQQTLDTGKAHFWSRSRRKIWLKGESSGHVQLIREILVDCDQDTVVFKVEQLGGAACHTGHRSCFFRKVDQGGLSPISEPVFDPVEVYGKKS